MPLPSEPLSPEVIRISITDADTEYSTDLPAKTKYFEIRNVGTADVRVAFVCNKVATPVAPYLTLKAGDVWRSADKLSFKQAVS